MIVIFCPKEDNYVNNIIEWLTFYKVSFVKVDLNHQKVVNFELDVLNDDFQFQIDSGVTLKYSEISYFFFRDGFVKYAVKDENSTGDIILDRFLELENKTILDFVYTKIMQKCLGWINRDRLNKLTQLSLAKKNGLCIPNSKILNSASSFERTFGNKKVITKAIQENVNYQSDSKIYTQRVETVLINDLPQSFHPSLFQEKVDKLFEVRSFYLEGRFYTIAFIDKVEGTAVDMRDNYDHHIYFKFDLPKEVETKLHHFMKDLGLKSGSMDLIYGRDEKFYFLEVNPEGQFEWVSTYGDYNLDKKIAEFLKHKNDDFEKETNN